MIDYLEMVLEAEQEDTRLLEGRRAAVRPPERKRPEERSTGGTKPPQEEDPVRAETPAPAEDAPDDGTRESLFPEEWITPELLEAPRRSWLPRGEDRAEAAGVLLQALSRTGRSLRALRGGSGVMTVTLPGEGGETASGPDLEALDLAMQRDARRYDGAFQLY